MLCQRPLILKCRLCLRQFSQRKRLAFSRGTISRLLTSEAVNNSSPSTSIPPPPMDGGPHQYPDKIIEIVNAISQLTLLETSQLNDLLKSTLKIPDTPVMAMGPMPTPAAIQENTPEESPEEIQTSFTVKLMKFSEDSKIKVIKELKAQSEGMNLVQAKKFIDDLPKEVKSGVSGEEANKMKAALEAAGGVVEIL